MSTQPEAAVERAAAAIAEVIMRGGDHTEAARAALGAAQPSPRMAVRAAKLLLTEKGVLPVVHCGDLQNPPRAICKVDDPGPGGFMFNLFDVTCPDCVTVTEDQLAECDLWIREGIPADRRIPGWQVVAEARAARGW